MSNVSQWSNTAANNNDTPPDGWPEGQAPSTVNDCARELMASVSRWYDDQKGELVTAGSSNAYTLTTNSTHAALADQSMFVFRADRANTGAATLNVDSLGAKSMRLNGSALASGYLVADVLYAATYNSTDDAYDLLMSLTPSQISTALSLGTMSTQAASSVAITGGSITGITDLAIADGGTGAGTVSDARNNLLMPVVKVKDTATSRSSTTSPTNDPDLNAWSLDADTQYYFYAYLRVTFASTTNGGLTLSVGFSQTPDDSGSATVVFFDTVGTTAQHEFSTALGVFSHTASVTEYTVRIEGVFKSNASTGGTISLNWAQESSDTDNTTLEVGSMMAVQKLA